MSSAPSTTLDRSTRDRSSLYHDDLHAWSQQQAAALLRRDFASVDWDNVIEEIDDLGRQERIKWTSYCANALNHLLKIEHFREARPETVSFWLKEIRNQRRLMFKQLRNAASLKSECSSLYRSAWEEARADAVRDLAELDIENKLKSDFPSAFASRDLTVPSECPYQLNHVTGIDLKTFSAKRHPAYAVLPPSVSRAVSRKLDRNDRFSR